MTPRQKQRAKRDKLFLKGPLRFGSIRKYIPDPTSRLILVAEAFRTMGNTPLRPSIELTEKVWDCAGINDRSVRSRVLRKIDNKIQDYFVQRRTGRTAVLWKISRTKEHF